LVIRHPLAPQGEIKLALVTDFDVKPAFHDITGNHLDGFTRTQHIPQNLAISFTFDRNDPTLEIFASAMWQAYRTRGRLPEGSVFQYVNEIDGSTSTNRYDGVAFKPDDFGSWKKESAVAQKLTGTAMDWSRVS
jgi:hypothetical protein